MEGFEPTFDTISIPITDNCFEDRTDYIGLCSDGEIRTHESKMLAAYETAPFGHLDTSPY